MTSKNQVTEKAFRELEALLKEWNSTSLGRRSFLASMPFLLSACAATTSNRHREGDNRGQNTRITPADERRMTKEILPQMRKDYPALKDPWMQKYVTQLGDRIVTANQLSGNPYKYSFTVVGVDMVNAFALPAGTVFVTAPLIEMAETEAELAGVIGHEIGHIKARHTAERFDQAKKAQKKTILSVLGGGVLGGAAGFGLGKLLCPPKDNECLAKATALGAAAGAGAGLLIQKYGFNYISSLSVLFFSDHFLVL
jgi:predicted Zn-dependent protease